MDGPSSARHGWPSARFPPGAGMVPAIGAVAFLLLARDGHADERAGLVGGAGSAGRFAAGPEAGLLLEVEGAWAATLPSPADPGQQGWGFGARAGWALQSGLSVHARYDDLGTEPSGVRPPLQLATAGLRYSVPFLVPMPFAEVDVGPAFVGGGVNPGGGAELGVSLPVARSLLVDLAAHDWLVPVAGVLRQTLSVGVGLAVTLPIHGR
jgi:hypothetical protein